MSHHGGNDTTEEEDSSSSWNWIIGISIFLLAFFGIKSYVSNLSWGGNGSSSNQNVTNNQPQPIVSCNKGKGLYTFSNNDDHIFVEIGTSGIICPKGGRVKVQPPFGESWTDGPNIHNTEKKLIGGLYTFSKIDPGATGVEIK